MNIIIIAAMAENRVIGKNNALPWPLKGPLKADMEHFKKLTNGWPCVMGRTTWESLPKRPLPGRPNIVISQSLSTATSAVTGAVALPSLQNAIKHCAEYENIFICGGASVYGEAILLANKIELTVIRRQYEGDTFFPEIDNALWEITKTEDFDDFSFISYSRICTL